MNEQHKRLSEAIKWYLDRAVMPDTRQLGEWLIAANKLLNHIQELERALEAEAEDETIS